MTAESTRLRSGQRWYQKTLVSSGSSGASSRRDRSRRSRLRGQGPRQVASPFLAGAIIALADETATAAASWECPPAGVFRPELLPLTVQTSANVITKKNLETLVTASEIARRGRFTPGVSPASGPGPGQGR